MPLVDLRLPSTSRTMPGDVRSFLHEAERRIERFQRSARVPGFVPTDSVNAYGVLRALSAAALVPGGLFCEWGSGFGVVACLAALLDYDACGIEIERELVDAARLLAADFDLPVEFVCGSFIPRTGQTYVRRREFAWLSTDGDTAYTELGLDPGDFSVIFAYPWPDEERLTEDLFERYAAKGAVLVTHHGGEEFRVRRKTRTR